MSKVTHCTNLHTLLFNKCMFFFCFEIVRRKLKCRKMFIQKAAKNNSNQNQSFKIAIIFVIIIIIHLLRILIHVYRTDYVLIKEGEY